jgi:diaminopimelate epimerase
MEIQFYKYQGTGNDFILLDNRNNQYSSLTTEQINHICDRRFGIGGDGLMMLNEKPGYDFEMKYYNSDGKEGSMCGNGGRCITLFAYDMGIHRASYEFIAPDGPHSSVIRPDGSIALKMKDVSKIESHKHDFVLDTGSPHYIRFVNDVLEEDVFTKGREIRNCKDFAKEGINVNFVEQLEEEDAIRVRTYERGVEDETYSCGTGVTAAALVSFHHERGFNEVKVKTKGGELTVEYERIDDDHYENIWLCGPAKKAFEGKITL